MFMKILKNVFLTFESIVNKGDKYYGYLIQKEVNSLKLLIENKNHEKILAIVGGGKINDKLKLLRCDPIRYTEIYNMKKN